MAAPMEVMLSSDASGMLWNSCVWDVQTGTALAIYKGGCSGPRSLCCLGGQLLMSAAIGKPLIYVWAVQKREQQQQRIVCPDVVSCLAVAANNSLCAAGIADKIHVWQTCSGNLLAVLSHHYQRVTCLCFTDDGSHLVTGGEDNLVMVWYVASLLQPSPAPNSSEPLHVWSQHALPVSDVLCGAGGSRSRVVSASHDQTCKLWDLATGQLLCNFVFDSPVCAVAMDTAEYHLFAGCLDGNIYEVNLFAAPVQTERHIQESKDAGNAQTPVFKGHSKPVTCLSVSMDGTLLASGSEDHAACIWHVQSRQQIRTFNHKGAVTNVAFVPCPNNLASSQPVKQTLPWQPFKRHLHSSGEPTDDGSTEGEIGVRIPDRQVSTLGNRAKDKEHELFQAALDEVTGASKKKNLASELSRLALERELEALKQTNQLLFQSAVATART